jgi:FKBP-type peptidyl-prolyl cis-trans isomerase 2
MVFNENDFIEVEYTAKDVGTNEIIATTDEEVAKKAGLDNKETKYGPTLVVLGANNVIRGLDRELRKMSVGESKSLTFKPEDAFGQRDEQLVRVMPLSEFRSHDINPYPGLQVRLEDVMATVKSVNSGRVVVDANHPYAGRDITYEIKVVKQITEPKGKIIALGKAYGAEPTDVSISGKDLSLHYDSKYKKDAEYFVSKASLVAAILTYMKDIEKVEIKEDYTKPENKKEAGAEASASADKD